MRLIFRLMPYAMCTMLHDDAEEFCYAAFFSRDMIFCFDDTAA